jgi:hypothetical protein
LKKCKKSVLISLAAKEAIAGAKTISLGGFKHSELEMPSKVNSENDMLETHHLEITKFMYSSFQCCNESEDCEEAIVERIAAKHQKIRNLIRMTELSMKG